MVASAPVPGATARRWRLNPVWLFSRDREYPNDAPTAEEAWLWFGRGLLCFGAATLGTGLVRLAAWQRFGSWHGGVTGVLSLTIVFGFLGPSVLSAWADRCLFTWPASLYAAFQLTVRACRRAEQRRGDSRTRWQSRAALVGFLLACYSYFALCRAVGLSVGWAFLFGFPTGLPFAALAARAEERGRMWETAGWTVLGFAGFFAGGQGLLLWKAAHVE